MIDNKGLTDEEVQKLINWKIDCKKMDEFMWKLHAKDIIRKIMKENKVIKN